MARNKFDIDEELETPFNIANFKRCKKYIKNSASMLIIGAVLSLLATVFALCGPYFVKMVIDNIEKQQAAKTADIMPILLICGLYVLCVLLSEVCTYFRTIVTSKAGQQIIHEIRVDIFSHIQKLSFNYFDSRPRGKILVRVVHYVNNVADFLSNGLINIVVQFLTVFIIIFFMLSLDVKLSLIVLSGLPIFIIYMVLIRGRQRRA